MRSPLTAQEAAEQVHELTKELDDRRRTAARLKAAKDDAEALYKSQKWRVLAAGVPGRNAEEREAHAMKQELAPDVRSDAASVAEKVGIKGWTPATLEDLRWLRDRADGITDASSAASYDTREKLKAWTSVLSWARAEYEQTMRGAA